MNSIIVCGTVSRDPEMRVENEKMKICGFSVAVQRPYVVNGKREVDFFEVSAFGKNAEFCTKYIKKGSKVVIRGQMESDRKEVNGGNAKITYWELKVAEIDFAANKAQQEEALEVEAQRKEDWQKKQAEKDAKATQKAAEAPAPEPKQESFMDIPEDLDDLPFA